MLANLGAAYDTAKYPPDRAKIAALIIELLGGAMCKVDGLTLPEYRTLKSGKVVAAVRMIIDRTGMGLKDAKNLVDSFIPPSERG